MKYLPIILGLLLCSFSMHANRIDSLRTDSDVYRFFVSIDSNFRMVNVNAYNKIYYDSSERKIADSLHVKVWQKVDLNDDGQTDLLAYVDIGGSTYLLAVISDNNKYKMYDLNLEDFDPIFPVVKKDGTKPVLFLYYYERIIDSIYKNYNFPPEVSKGKLVYKRLIYRFNFFLEFNDKPTHHVIQTITYSTDSCFGKCPIFKLSIDSKRNAIYKSIMYSGDRGKYKTIIDTESYNQILSILDYIDFLALSDNYKVDWTDDATSCLTIMYDDGKVKKIEDYGEQGTYGLQALYNELFKLRKNQKWKKRI